MCSYSHTATHGNTLHHTATHSTELQHTAYTATHCITLQRTATHCNTLQHRIHRGSTHINELAFTNTDICKSTFEYCQYSKQVLCDVVAFSKNLNRKITLQSCSLCLAALGVFFLFKKNVYKNEHAANCLGFLQTHQNETSRIVK